MEEEEKARDLRERAARPENEGNLAALMILMAVEIEERERDSMSSAATNAWKGS